MFPSMWRESPSAASTLNSYRTAYFRSLHTRVLSLNSKSSQSAFQRRLFVPVTIRGSESEVSRHRVKILQQMLSSTVDCSEWIASRSVTPPHPHRVEPEASDFPSELHCPDLLCRSSSEPLSCYIVSYPSHKYLHRLGNCLSTVTNAVSGCL